MKFISFRRGSVESIAALDGRNRIIDLCAIDPQFPTTMLALIQRGDEVVRRARSLIQNVPTSAYLNEENITVLAPIPRPRKNVFCVGRNYREHVDEGHRARGTQVNYPAAPQFFTKAPTAVTGPDAKVPLDPLVTQKFDYEAELGVVIGSGGKNICEADAMGAIFGFTIVNDFTARDLQRHHDQWFKGKSLDGSCAIGPWIVHRDTISNPQNLAISLSVNGEQRQASRTAQMIFSIPRIIRDLSLGMTLEPGDIIATGTPQGVGFAMDPPQFLADGDKVVVEIEQIGELRNQIEEVSSG